MYSSFVIWIKESSSFRLLFTLSFWDIFSVILGIILGLFMPKLPADSYAQVYKILDFVGQAFISIIQII